MQPSFCVILVLSTLQLLVLFAQGESSVIDSFRIFNNFPSGVAISNSNNDSEYECLTAKRIWLNAKAKQGKYIWILKERHGKSKIEIPFYLSQGSSPDTFSYKVGSEDATPEEGKFMYTDYEHCSVLDMPYNGHQCILWSSELSKDSLPQECMDKFADICGVGIPLYNQDLCPVEIAN
ncbi:uncharacterized protein LOC125947366 [Dermacentor silvarum]|uniref:uncharacterized protein LOC125947366 n=1 Tax=Dermacentor silvarum TaxID=543639 RepID=UPI0021013701|nr:uncharacterized protein LOC125947366 [Dermacentor silvarum]